MLDLTETRQIPNLTEVVRMTDLTEAELIPDRGKIEAEQKQSVFLTETQAMFDKDITGGSMTDVWQKYDWCLK